MSKIQISWLLCMLCWSAAAKLFKPGACLLLCMLCPSVILCSLGASIRIEVTEVMLPTAAASGLQSCIVIQPQVLFRLPSTKNLHFAVPQLCAALLTHAARRTLQAKLVPLNKVPLQPRGRPCEGV